MALDFNLTIMKSLKVEQFSNGKHLLTELKKYGFEAERVADYGCYCQFLTDGGVNPPGMVHFLLVHE